MSLRDQPSQEKILYKMKTHNFFDVMIWDKVQIPWGRDSLIIDNTSSRKPFPCKTHSLYISDSSSVSGTFSREILTAYEK